MASQTRSAGAGASDTSVGTRTWSNHANITVSDDSRATAQTVSSGSISHYLKASTFGFTIPAGANIDGIEVSVEKRAAGSGNATVDHRIRIVKGGTIGATDKASASVWPGPSVDGIVVYGSPTDLWGETWTDSDINAAGFGMALAATNSNAVASTPGIDHVQITVYYTEGGAQGTLSVSVGGAVAALGSKNAAGGSIASVAGDLAAAGTKGAVGVVEATASGAVAFVGQGGIPAPQGEAAVTGGGTFAAAARKQMTATLGISGGGSFAASSASGGEPMGRIEGATAMSGLIGGAGG